MPRILLLTPLVLVLAAVPPAGAQEELPPGETTFHTFSIAAVDPETGESGVAVTTRNPCVANGVPWVRVGVGAVATQARTRTQYGEELLSRLAAGMSAEEALRERLAEDEGAPYRQVGVVGLTGGVAQHTGSEARTWAGHRSGPDYAAQGNLLVGPEVVDAVAEDFEATRGSGLSLADRLISALEAGQAAGGDARRGRRQSAGVLVADPREGGSRRDDGISTHINVCEHATPVAELRRIHDAVSQKLGYRTLTMFAGSDVVQLRILISEGGCAADTNLLGEEGDLGDPGPPDFRRGPCRRGGRLPGRVRPFDPRERRLARRLRGPRVRGPPLGAGGVPRSRRRGAAPPRSPPPHHPLTTPRAAARGNRMPQTAAGRPVRIDLRSDTVSLPTDEMRAAMAAAEVGDDVYGDDPSVRRLEERTAEVLGKDAAVLTPTGTMSNQIAIRCQTEPGDLVLAERQAHAYLVESGGPAALSGATVVGLEGARGVFSAGQVRAAVRTPHPMVPDACYPVARLPRRREHPQRRGRRGLAA